MDFSVLLILLAAVATRIADCIIIGRVTCDNIMEFYADGVLVESSPNWFDVSTVILPDTTQLLAFKCVDQGVVAGIKGFFSNGIKTDNTWKCTDTLYHGWETIGYDDSSWETATVPDSSVWGIRPEALFGYADWIWTSDGIADTEVYCRRAIVQDTSVCDSLIAAAETALALAPIDSTTIFDSLVTLRSALAGAANATSAGSVAPIQALEARLDSLFLAFAANSFEIDKK